MDAQKRKNLAVLAKQKKIVPSPFAKGQKLKAVAEAAPSEEEKTYSELVFKRKRKVATAISVAFDSDGRAPSYRDFPPSVSPSRDIVVQEGRGESASEGDQWDSSSDPTSFLQKMLFFAKVKGRLENLEEDHLMEHMRRQMEEALVANCLLLSKMRKAKALANVEVLQAVGLKRQVSGLSLEVEELQKFSKRLGLSYLGSLKRPWDYMPGTTTSPLK